MIDSPLITSLSGTVATIEFNQPNKRNAINITMWSALETAVKTAENAPDIKVLIVKGHGDHFAAGADISEFKQVYETAENARSYTEIMQSALKTLQNCSKPTIALIRGSCIGAGCSIAMACDFRFADTTAEFAVTPAKLGLVYSIADTRRLISVVGELTTKDLLFTGRVVNSEEAFNLNLCDRLYETNFLETQIEKFVMTMTKTSSYSIEKTKETLKLIRQGVSDNNLKAMELMVNAFMGEDFHEGYTAFLEKRPPVFPNN